MTFIITYWISAFILRPILGVKLNTSWFVFQTISCAIFYALLKYLNIIH